MFACRVVIPAIGIYENREIQGEHQRRGMLDLARFRQRAVRVVERRLGITEQPQGQRTEGQARYPEVLAKSRHQSPVRGRAI